jgi:phage terminase Nu1 subunit (DNA packaging protein)
VASDLYVQRARLTKEQADKAEMDNRKTKGELVPVSQAAKLLEKVVLAFRSQILALPTKAAPHVHGCKAIAETKEALETSLHDALNELAELDVSRLGSR